MTMQIGFSEFARVVALVKSSFLSQFNSSMITVTLNRRKGASIVSLSIFKLCFQLFVSNEVVKKSMVNGHNMSMEL